MFLSPCPSPPCVHWILFLSLFPIPFVLDSNASGMRDRGKENCLEKEPIFGVGEESTNCKTTLWAARDQEKVVTLQCVLGG